MLNMNHICRRLLLPFLLLSSGVSVAQESMHVKGNVVIFNKMDGKPITASEPVYYGFFKDKEEAEKAMARIERAREGSKGSNISEAMMAEENINTLRKELKITSRTTGKRRFDENVISGMAFVFMTPTDFETAMVVFKEGQTEYKDIIINVKRVKEVVSTGKAREADVIGGGITGDPDDGNEYFPVRFKLSAGNGRTDSRLIIQTYAVDCQTEDTIDYCNPLVYEGEKYHSLQNRRMAFDYMKNDKIALGYSDTIVLDVTEPVEVNTVVVYKKPDAMKKHTFKGPFKFVLEDYHHVYREGGWEGTCLRERPFKFLDFTPALALMPLTEEFYEDAKTQIENKKRDLDLLFEVGTDVLKNDSMNDVKKMDLVKELRSYGNQLLSPTIIGAASPDGSRAVNERLARQRAQKAVNMIAPYLGQSAKPNISVKMYSWTDVVVELRRKGHEAEAEAIDGVLAGGTRDDVGLTRAIKALPGYNEVIEPVLAGMRVMKCAYKVLRQYVMTASECVEAFHAHKKEYQEGLRHFSNGDYYNLFDNIRDSVELDELTIMAYREILQNEDYATESRMAPYVANRMALMNLRRGLPQSGVLNPFIDYSRKAVDANKYVNDMLTIKVNRREILTNQAVTYYQEQKLDSAMYLINLIKSAGVKDKNIEMLEYYMDLKRFHYLKRRNAEQEQRYQSAKDLVLAASADNKAILYTEIKDWGMRDQADQWVSQMDDGDPKKWYLKALLAVDKAGTLDEAASDTSADGGVSGPDIGGGFTLLTPDQEMDLLEKQPDRYKAYLKQKNKYKEEHDGKLPEMEPAKADSDEPAVDMDGIPNYLAYFQHSFDLEPGYKRLYFSEGHVVEDMRRKFKYKKKNIPAYRRLFEALKRQDDLKKLPKKADEEEMEMGVEE